MRPFALRPRFVSLRARFLWGTVLVIGLVMAVLIGIVEHRQRTAIVEEVQRRGVLLAQNLATISAGPLVLYNFTALEQNVERLTREADVAYAILLDPDGRVTAHSEDPAQVGNLLTDPVSARAAAAAAPLVQPTTTGKDRESLYDFAVPIEIQGQKWGTVRVGLSRRRMEAQIARTRRELALLTLVLLVAGGLASALVARRIARPVRQLAAGAAAVSRGDLDQRIESTTSDEIGGLALAFNEMTDRLRQQRAAIEAANAELARRFGELSDLKRYTDSILGSLTSGVITFDREGRVVTLNAAAEALTGRSLAEARGRACAEVFAHVPELADLLRETAAGRAGGVLVSASVPRRDAAPVPVELTAAPLKGADGQDLGVVAALRDLTAVRALEEQLRRSDRLAAIGTLAAGLAHEIKNPLTSLLTFSRYLPRRFADERFRQRFQSVVPRELERINGIVNGLLRLARPTRLSLAPVGLPELLEPALELYAEQLEAKRITVVREYAPDVPRIQADREHLYQALVNLVANALDAMGEGGTLTLRTGWTDAEAALASGGKRREPHVRIEVGDTGSGIVPAQALEVFNPFFTTKPAGTGLGLALVHKIVEDHGGAVTFRSTPGSGTTFAIVLPLAPEPEVRRSTGATPAAGVPRAIG
jgi:PAS domain S-box-containing protein